MFVASIQQINGAHLFCFKTLFSAKMRQRDKTYEMAQHWTKRMTKPLSRVALWLLLIWLCCLLSVFQCFFISSLILWNPLLFKENLRYRGISYHIIDQLLTPKRENTQGMDNFSLSSGSFASLVLWTSCEYINMLFRYSHTTSTFLKDSARIHIIPKWRPINYCFVCMLIRLFASSTSLKNKRTLQWKWGKEG